MLNLRDNSTNIPNKSMNITRVTDINIPELAPYARLTEAQLRNKLNPEKGLFITESPKVIRVALDAGYKPVSMLCEERHITGDASDILERMPELPVFTSTRDMLASLTGYTLTRGVLCAMQRPAERTVEDLVAQFHEKPVTRYVVIDGVVDATNIGAIFRSAAALGIDGVMITRTSCDPLNRRAVRVSMGSVFLVPWAWLDEPVNSLNRFGIKTAAMALTDNSVSLDDASLCAEPHLALIMGTEGDGLPFSTIASTDYVVRIPMRHGVDSLNVAAASAVAFWQLCKH